MSNDQVSVTTSTSWFSRLGNAVKGVLFGFVAVLGAIVLLFWNEGRSIQSIRTNNEGAAAVLSVNPDRVDAANNGKLVHLSAAGSAEGQRRDDVTGVAADGLILSRSVEYFQWVESSQSETRTKLGGGQETVTTYTYATEWTGTPQDSAGFNNPTGHQNPPATLKDGVFAAEQATVGGFRISAPVLNQLSAQTPLLPSAEQAQTVSSALGRPVAVQENALYVGQNASAPQVGDMRITYRYLPQNTVLSLVGAQTGNEITAYLTKTGSSILMVRTGTASAGEMFQAAKAANQTMSWILRGVGFVVMIIGFSMVLGPLGVLGDVVPFIGSIVRMGTGLIAGVLGVSISLVVIAVAWLAFRPIVAVAMLAVAGAAVAGVLWLRKNKAAAAPAVS
ncbi:TMEM43 family protein [Brevundimonas sp.]|uniref:TMEM43 family protein n=1 Tax=Brevundimonas sp. TaxID=1871086 RepID=UPI00289CA35C|nr:TMEM43 family protein [Brevundimonas sp.]